MSQVVSLKTIFVDRFNRQYNVRMFSNGRAHLFESGHVIYSGTVQGIRDLGLVPLVEALQK
jgi:hypothetical protein